MLDDYDMNDLFDDNFNSEYNCYDKDYPSTKLYFYKGAYYIQLVTDMRLSDGLIQCSFIIERTQFDVPNSPSLFDVFESFNNSFLLEFLVSILVDGTLNFDSLQKVISIKDEEYICIYVTASFSMNQNYLHIEDEMESDEKATDVINIGKTQIMRTHQVFYSITQAAKCCTIKYDAIKDKDFSWDSDIIDWNAVYKGYIEPYIRLLMAMSLKVPINSVTQYSDYMTFQVQINADRLGSALNIEIYILPKTIFNRRIVYNNVDGREIYICSYKNGETTPTPLTADEARICAGSQNLSLIPINNYKIRHTIINGKDHIVIHETPLETDVLYNKFALSMYRYTNLPLEDVVYLTNIKGISASPFQVPTFKNSKEILTNCNTSSNQKELEKKIEDNTVILDTIIDYFGFINPINENLDVIELDEVTRAYGVIAIAFKTTIDPDIYVYSIDESNELTFLPKKFYEIINNTYHNPKDTKFYLLPIRALPAYREFILVGSILKTENVETQSDIIEKTKNADKSSSAKSGLFRSLFGH